MTQRRIYQEEFPYFVTFRIKENYPLFENDKMAELFAKEIFVSARIKRYDILAWQIMPEHVHLLAYIKHTDRRDIFNDRTLEKVRSVGEKYCINPERTLSSVRSYSKNNMQSVNVKRYSISDLMQSVKGNFSRKIHVGNIWQRRFYIRIVNNRRYLRTVVEYIENNPAKAELSEKYHKTPYQFFDWDKIKKLF